MNSIYQQRTFSEKFSYAFNWMSTNRKAVLKYYALLFLPISFLMSFGMMSAMELQAYIDPTNFSFDTLKEDMGPLSTYYLLTLAGSFLGTSMFFALFNISEQLHKPLNETTFGYVWKQMKKNMGKVLLAAILIVFFVVVLCAIMFTLSWVNSLINIVTIPAMIAVIVALMAFGPLYLLNDEPLFESLAHALKLGFKSWWGFFSTGLVMTILVYLIQLVFSLPLQVCTSLGTIIGTGEGFGGTLLYIVCIAFATLACFVNFVLSPLSFLILTVQYGHAANKHEGTTDFDNMDMEVVSKTETGNE